MSKKRVLIVDDSQLITDLLTQILSSDERLEVVGTASDPFCARDKIKALNPDVITLDIEMPRMDGLTFLRNIMRLRPIPIVMISSLTQQGADATLEALALGAIDFVPKPKVSVSQQMKQLSDEICRKVRMAANANVQALESGHSIAQKRSPPPILEINSRLSSKIDLIAIGASTGGTEALKVVVCRMPELMPPIVVVQHMPKNFTQSFAQRVDSITNLVVEEFTEDGQQLKAGRIYIAHGGHHMIVKKRANVLKGYIVDSPPVNRHCPAVDVMFESIAEWSTNNVIGVILTGMGADGARGMGELHANGAETIAQDEVSSVVWGMPRVAIEQDAVSRVLPLSKIGRFLIDRCY
ncbi:chemotaxis response regulator protein-glutamate methylesterase [Candidatus Endobugula sertula]|uniref:Protein-glutamate methylesterase/protein-glutamine glutaminase n=1 Tax=Candidatus Endobugula sertula TaxID=62101 RepID=A0A1D2QQU5_9GAMM|nr:chemotaxis response regulator protein-glutamate methylesterase [Candidatus Endobugula sertula]